LSWIQQFFQGVRTKQIEGDNLENLLHGHTDLAQEFLVCQKQIHGQIGVYLNNHGIFRIANEALDTQILLDFAEEYLNLPAVFEISVIVLADKRKDAQGNSDRHRLMVVASMLLKLALETEFMLGSNWAA
jgi:hypothetical protein